MPTDEEIKQEVKKQLPENSEIKDKELVTMNPMEGVKYIVGRVFEQPQSTSLHQPDIDQNCYIQNVHFPPEGGIMSKLSTFKEPYRGFPYWEAVGKLDDIKKILRFFSFDLIGILKKTNKIKLIFLFLFGRKQFENSFESLIRSFHVRLLKIRLKPQYWCQPVAEIYRAFNCEIEKTGRQHGIEVCLRDYACILMEFDNAYRYRIQYIISRLDKETLKKEPIKELQRLLDLMIGHESPEWGSPAQSAKLLKKYLWLLRFQKRYFTFLVNVLLELNLDEMKMTKEDLCFCEERNDFDFEVNSFYLLDRVSGKESEIKTASNKILEKISQIDEKLKIIETQLKPKEPKVEENKTTN